MNKKINRKDFFKESLNNIGSFFNEIFSDELENLSVLFPEIIRPPGAQNEEIFQKLCNRCGECIRACPFFSLQPVFKGNQFDQGTPSLRLGEAFCRFCEDIPCIKACPTEHYRQKYSRKTLRLGKLKLFLQIVSDRKKQIAINAFKSVQNMQMRFPLLHQKTCRSLI